MIPRILVIAGSDSGGGAGIQADIKTAMALGAYAMTAVTAVTAQDTHDIHAIHVVPLPIILAQIGLALMDPGADAVKTGMLGDAATIEAVAGLLADTGLPLVVDPVMVASSGDVLLQGDALEAYRARLFPLAALVTPNMDEARVLLGRAVGNIDDLHAGGGELCARHGTAFLMKGGHLGGDEAVDVLCLPGGERVEFRAPFTRGVSTHGTGCTYSAAITAGLAQGLELRAAVAQAKRYVTAAIGGFFRWEKGAARVDALNHFTTPSS